MPTLRYIRQFLKNKWFMYVVGTVFVVYFFLIAETTKAAPFWLRVGLVIYITVFYSPFVKKWEKDLEASVNIDQ